MLELTARLPEQICETARALWAALSVEDQQQIESRYRHQIAEGGWRADGEPIEGVQVRVWGSKPRKYTKSDDFTLMFLSGHYRIWLRDGDVESTAWQVLLDVALRVGLSAERQGWQLTEAHRGGSTVYAFKLHELELEQIKALPAVERDEGRKGRAPGVGAKLLQLVALGLNLLAERYEVEVRLCG